MIASPKEFGWKAILDDPNHRGLAPCSLVKAPHHGGESAHEQEMWDRLVEMGSIIEVAPYWASSLPRPSDIDRMKRVGDVWQAARSCKLETIAESGFTMSEPARAGLIQSRRRLGEDQWRIYCEEPAFLAAAHEPVS